MLFRKMLLKEPFVNLALSHLHGGSLEITLTIPLILLAGIHLKIRQNAKTLRNVLIFFSWVVLPI